MLKKDGMDDCLLMYNNYNEVKTSVACCEFVTRIIMDKKHEWVVSKKQVYEACLIYNLGG